MEAEIERYLRRKVEGMGGLCLKFVSSVSGVPDRIIVYNSLTIFVELKAPGQKPRPLQIRMIEKLKKSGARVEVIDSKESVDNLILELRG